MSFAAPIDENMIPSRAQVSDWEGPAGTYGFCKALIEVSSIDPWASTLIVAGISITIAWIVNAERRPDNPSHKSFLWGYFIAFSGGLDGLWIFLSHLRLAACLQPSINLLVATYGAALIFFSYAAYKRSKIGWIGASVLSLNPIWWVTNYFYGKSRWHEFMDGLPIPRQLLIWQPIKERLNARRFNEQCKLIFQNMNAAAFLAEYCKDDQPQELEVIEICRHVEERARKLGIKAYTVRFLEAVDLEVLLADNKEMRRLYDFTASAYVKKFDTAFQPILGWKRHCERKMEDAPN